MAITGRRLSPEQLLALSDEKLTDVIPGFSFAVDELIASLRARPSDP
ncbi:MAG TPA: hypothetical protein VNA20_00315 [Frankiaceae bacterium]|nr:hypothetical protein [Frankiaceae bacterium]